MTVINNIEIDCAHYEMNESKAAIRNNDPIEDQLHVIIVISNPCMYGTRYKLANEFIRRFENEEPGTILYIVELAYNDQKFYVTNHENPRHLQLRSDCILWHKENLINIGVEKLLPKNWRAFAWIDADIEFESCTWAQDTLRILNGTKDVVQLFSHAVDMDSKKMAMGVFQSFGFQYTKGIPYTSSGVNLFHPGFAYACTRKAYEKMGGLYDVSILGAGDYNMAMSFIGLGQYSINKDTTEGYKRSISEFQKRTIGLRLGYTPGVIRHYYHGKKSDRRYSTRWMILVNNLFDPFEHITRDNHGIITKTKKLSGEFIRDVMKYFSLRNEDSR